jgi:hypothetical protein
VIRRDDAVVRRSVVPTDSHQMPIGTNDDPRTALEIEPLTVDLDGDVQVVHARLTGIGRLAFVEQRLRRREIVDGQPLRTWP